ncbi:NAD(P)-binding domain-containing protein [Geothrix sp. PMB-07]|uniref:NAD(P)-binding domain-containing protein n=1 Tax=Geothrix sp. PMB-07 TaxID=3068640 RepID=UPI0027416ADE|nr:NAD(P)-binding domain-containing protein [Geothrix sp. PMB-07]WLT30182.1 NAD(P)-binding domain-containing protein [Geothrix sp. PMB-07]
MRIGFIGLGTMGQPMARNLLGLGHALTVYNRTPGRAKALLTLGAKEATSISDAVKEAEVAITMVSDDQAVSELVYGPGGLLQCLAPKAIHLCMSTISVETSAALASAHAKANQGYVAAPVFGRADSVESRRIWIVAGGPEPQVNRCLPIFVALGRDHTRVGSKASLAHALKQGGMTLSRAMEEAVAQILGFAEKAGMDHSNYLRLLNTAIFKSHLVDANGAVSIRPSFDPRDQSLDLAANEMLFHAARRVGVPVPASDLLNVRLQAAGARGWGEQDLAALSEDPDPTEAPASTAPESPTSAPPVPEPSHAEEADVETPPPSPDPPPPPPVETPIAVEKPATPEPPAPVVVPVVPPVKAQPVPAVKAPSSSATAKKTPNVPAPTRGVPPVRIPTPVFKPIPPPGPPSVPVQILSNLSPSAQSAPTLVLKVIPAPLPPLAGAAPSRSTSAKPPRRNPERRKGNDPKRSQSRRQEERRAIPPSAETPSQAPAPEPAQTPKPAPSPTPATPVSAPRRLSSDTFTAVEGGSEVLMDLEQTSHFEVIMGQVWAWSQGKRYHTPWRTLAEVEGAFKHVLFLPIKRHLLLRPEAVQNLKPTFGGGAKADMGGNQEIDVGRAAAQRLKELLGL